jgi:serine protease AprX
MLKMLRHSGRYGRTLSILVASLLAIALVSPGVGAVETASMADGNDAPGQMTLSMAVRPGEPVPMRIVTEKSSGELYKKGFRGQGIDVALIDSGVAPVPGLNQPGKILYGPDLSGEAGMPNLANLDTYGHGTHLAGIIAGNDGDQVGGIAPDSRIVSIKVAGATGETHVEQVVAAIDWVVEHRNDNGLNIRVLNLSLGLPDVPSSAGDPLSAAVERAWNAGIVVVAAAGNRGNTIGGIDSPAVSPYVLAIGAHESYDSSGAQDWIAPWSSGGNTIRHPDVVAPGRSIMSFRVPGSTLDQLYPTARVEGRYFLGSGTSQSAAVVSGFAATILSRDPSLTPDQVKYLFMAEAVDLKDTASQIDGNGKIQPKEVARSLKDASKAPTQVWTPALSGSNGGVTAPTGTSWSGGNWSGTSWSGGTWSGTSWSGTSWSGTSWSGTSWSGTSWSGTSWSGTSWSDASWSGTSWSGTSWSGTSWSGTSWSGSFWSALGWN